MRPTLARKGKKKKARRGGFRRKVRSAGRRFARRIKARKPHLGLLGKTGVAVAGAVPVAFGAINAATPWLDPGYANVPIQGKLQLSLAKFVNTLSVGFGLGEVFPGSISGHPITGDIVAPPGAWVKTTTVGFGFVVTDFIMGALFKVTGKQVPRTKLMGRQMLTG